MPASADGYLIRLRWNEWHLRLLGCTDILFPLTHYLLCFPLLDLDNVWFTMTLVPIYCQLFLPFWFPVNLLHFFTPFDIILILSEATYRQLGLIFFKFSCFSAMNSCLSIFTSSGRETKTCEANERARGTLSRKLEREIALPTGKSISVKKVSGLTGLDSATLICLRNQQIHLLFESKPV